MDGASESRVFFRFCIPQILAGLAATFVFGLILTWNEFLFALLLTGVETRTVPVAMARTLGGESRRGLRVACSDRDVVFASHFLRHIPFAEPASARGDIRYGEKMTIELKNLTKRFGDLTAVDAINFSVGDGEVLCLLGPSGCGKTTTLRMIAGLEYVTEGDVVLQGKRVNDLAPRERNVAMSFQFYALYPSLTVAENLAFPLHAEGLSSSDIDSRVKKISDTLQLGSILGRTPGQLAEGEKQRVAVGRSIIRDPTCFLFDEPLSRLDVQLREEMRGEIKEVLQDLSRPTVIVTHDQLEALTMADRIAVMRDGRVEQVDTPHNVFQKPANLFVAGFIGTPQMNLLPATLTAVHGDGKAEFAVEGGQSMTIVVDRRIEELSPGTQVTLGVRPRNLEISNEPAQNGLSTLIDMVEPMGAETLIHLKYGEQELRLVTDWRIQYNEGDRVNTKFPPSVTHVFTHDEQVLRTQ